MSMTNIRNYQTVTVPVPRLSVRRPLHTPPQLLSGERFAEHYGGNAFVQRAAQSTITPREAPPIVHDVLQSPSRPLDIATQNYMEPHFGRDLSQVRVHTDAQAAESARAIDALAYTVSKHIVFGKGQYAPDNVEGKRVLAHELTHVMQQAHGQSALQTQLQVGAPNTAYEREAEQVSATIENQHYHTQQAPAPPILQRLPFGITLPSGIRGLDPAEEAILRPVFGASLNYSEIKLSDAVGGGGRPYTVAAFGSQIINIGPAAYRTPGSDSGLLIHETTHCWQAQHHYNRQAYMTNSVLSQAAASALGGDPYCYIPGKPFSEYGAEQIAQQVENGVAAIISHVKSVAAGVVDPDNVLGLSTARWEKRGAPGVVC